MWCMRLSAFLLPLTLLSVICTGQDIREPPSIQEPTADTIPDRYIKQSGKFQLPCKATGKPTPTYIWMHNGKELDLNKGNIRQLGNGVIEISDFNERHDDEGEYQCMASNKYGKSLSQIFTVTQADLSSSWRKEVVAYGGDLGKPSMIVKSPINSVPDASYSWKTVASFDDHMPKRLVRNKRILQDLEGNLYFTSLQASDALDNARLYKIDAFNSIVDSAVGGCYSSLTVDTNVTVSDRPPYRMYPRTSTSRVNVLEGTEMKIQCIFGGYPDVDVTWLGPATGWATTEESGTVLVVKNMTKEAAGEYGCTGTNRAGFYRAKITAVMHTIPKFTPEGRPSKQILTEGETATFTCQTTEDTNPQATVDWMTNGVLVQDRFPGAHTEVTTIQNGKRLTIVDLDRDEDIKVVQCKASNIYKTVIVDAPLNVLKRTILTEKPMNQTIQPDTIQIIFVCRAISDPSTPITMEWLRDGMPLSHYDDPRMVEDRNEGSLTLNMDGLIKDQKAAYRGDYTCTATNGYSGQSHTAVLTYTGSFDFRDPTNVQQPSPEMIPKKYTRKYGKVHLPCEATGNPAPTYIWLHNGKQLELNKSNIRHLEMGNIEIIDFNEYDDDEGEYQCVASNKYGKSLSQIFKVMVAFLNTESNREITPYCGDVGKPLMIPRTVFDSAPEPTYTWNTIAHPNDVSPKVVTRSKRILQDLEGNLYFTSLHATDALENGRFYKIDVYNDAVDMTLGGSYSKVIVNSSVTPIDRRPARMYPKTSMLKVDVLEGTEMRIQCIFSGYPDVDVTWSGPATSCAIAEESGTILVVQNMTKEAAGEYECTGTNRAGSAKSKINVVMHTFPKFTPKGRPLKQILTEGETATFTCQTTEDTSPQATLDWMINGVLIQDQFPGYNFHWSSIHNGKLLTITNLDRDEDIRVVQCKASNQYKTVYANAPLIVLKRTVLMEKPVNQVIVSNTTQVVFVCKATSDPSTPLTMLWQRDGKTLLCYDDTRMIEDKDAGTLTLNLAGLSGNEKAAYSGEYMCMATNGYSTDAHTAVLEYRREGSTR